MTKAIVMKPSDNVATVVEEVSPGTDVVIAAAGGQQTIRVVEKIAFGHKFATRDIKAGKHVHVHNLESTRGRGDK